MYVDQIGRKTKRLILELMMSKCSRSPKHGYDITLSDVNNESVKGPGRITGWGGWGVGSFLINPGSLGETCFDRTCAGEYVAISRVQDSTDHSLLAAQGF